MALNINTNIGALGAAAAATSVNKSMETAMERLSTGLRVNTAADDAAGVAIASRLTSEIRGTNQAIRNAMDGQALIDTAEGAHNEIVNILQRMRELAVQSANDTNDSTDRANLNAEFEALTTEIDRIAGVTTWAGQSLLTGVGGNHGDGTFILQVGGNTGAEDTIEVAINAMTSAALGSGTQTAGEVATAGVTAVSGSAAVAEVVEVSDGGMDFDADNGAGTVTLTVGTVVLTHTKASGDTIAEAITGLQADSDYDANVFTIAANGTNDGIVITYAAGDVADEAISLADGTVTENGVLGTQGADAVTAVTGVAEIAEVDISGYTVTAGKTYTLNVGDVELSYTAVADDDYDDLITGFQADADYDATSFTVTQSSGTLSVTQASTGAITSPTITFDDGLFDISTQDAATTSIDLMDAAIESVNTQRAELGAISNRLDSTVANLTNISTNLEAGRSRIQDADFAAESTNLAKAQILQQASMAMLAQANASKQGVLQLLQG